MKRTGMRLTAVAAVTALLLGGCGEQPYSLTEDEEGMIVDYSAHAVAKFNTSQPDGLANVSRNEQETEAVDESQALLTYYQEMIDSGMDLSESLADEQENYDKLYNKLKAAKSAYTTKSVEAEKKYKEAMLSYENADSQYSADVTGVDVSVDTAQDTLTDAKEALSEFEIFVGDGTIYSDYDGTIMSVGYEAGDDLSAGTSIVTFADTDAVTMTVSVSEEDISEIAIGDEVMIELNAYEDQTFSGEVESIDTSVSSGSSTVSYNVTVKINGDVDGIYTDMTGNVTFIEKQVADVVYVSNKAIINEGTASYVKVKDSDGTIEKKRSDYRIFRWRQCGDHGGTFRGRDGSDRKSGDGRMKPSELLRLVWINITQNKFKNDHDVDRYYCRRGYDRDGDRHRKRRSGRMWQTSLKNLKCRCNRHFL